MKFTRLDIPDVILIEPLQFGDNRGFFSEVFKSETFERETGVSLPFVQDNFSYSKHKGTIRGLHFQAPPFEQGKLVRCSLGRIMDVAVDARTGSPTHGQHVKAELSRENGHQLWVPPGFLHGFMTLEDDCDVTYKVTHYYSKTHDGNVAWNDPDLDIDWGWDGEVHCSEKDKLAPKFREFQSPFTV